MSIFAKVIHVPGTVKEVGLQDGATVADALAAASTSVGDGESLKLNGADTTLSAVVTDGSRIVIAKGAKGNS